jgi:hypothetical protein
MRTWATPFVVTVALSSAGCSKSTEHGEPRPPTPPRVADAAVVQQPPPAIDASAASPPAVAFLGRLRRDGDACTFHFEVVCDPGEKCNPPPPRDLPCPAGLQPGGEGRVTRVAEATCQFELPDPCVKRDPAPPCNPPEPLAIACP